MSRIAWLVAVCGLALTAAPALADDPKPAKKTDPLEQVLATLDQEFQLKEGANVHEIPLLEMLQFLSKQYNQTFMINEEAFRLAGVANISDEKPKVLATQLRGVSVRQVLNVTLDSLNATYLLRNGTVEIVPIQYAAKATKSAVGADDTGRVRLNEPLVAAIFKEVPLNEAVAKLAETHDLTVSVSPQAGNAKAGSVTARMLNVPADKAIELLALQYDLRVVRKGTAFLLTSKDHANELFSEKLDKERQRIEIEKLWQAPARPPAPPMPPEK